MDKPFLLQHNVNGTHKAITAADIALRRPWIDVRLFGAKGDGENDDTVAIQNAIIAADNSGGGVVFFPPGEYLIGLGDENGAVARNIYLTENITLKGMGPTSILRSHNKREWIDGNPGDMKTNGPLIKCLQRNATGVKTVIHNILIENLHLIGERSEGETFEAGTKEYLHGIALDGVRNCTIRNCIIENFHGDGICVAQSHVDDPDPNEYGGFTRDIDIYDNELAHNLRGGVSCISGKGIRIFANEIYGETYAIHLEPGDSEYHKTLEDVHVFHNDIHDITSGLPLWMGKCPRRIWIVDNNFRDCEETHTSDSGLLRLIGENIIFSRNHITNCHTSGNYFLQLVGRQAVISDNIFEDCSTGLQFLNQYTYPQNDSSEENSGGQTEDPLLDFSDRSAVSWHGNVFFNCTGPGTSKPGTTAKSICFFGSGGKADSIQYSSFVNNICMIGNFYYGIGCDSTGFLIANNVFQVCYGRVERIIKTNDSPRSYSNVIGNNIAGDVRIPIEGISHKLDIGHNMGLEFQYHSGNITTGRFVNSHFRDLDNNPTPDVSTSNHFRTSNSDFLEITNFLSGVDGQEITISVTPVSNLEAVIKIEHSDTIRLTGGMDFIGRAYDTITLVFDGERWLEKSRSIKSAALD